MDQNVEGKNAATDAVQVRGQFEGNIHISEDVIVELAKKTILGIPNIQTANMGIASKFGIGRKSGDGIRVSVGMVAGSSALPAEPRDEGKAQRGNKTGRMRITPRKFSENLIYHT
ncbi:MAG: hypothetical protein LBT15_04130, partial [Synergistaceae bacterium]|nr:hypothetical protein [Synergistaceae bacterium]